MEVSRIVFESRPGEIRAAALDKNGHAVAFDVERSHRRSHVGDIRLGRVKSVNKGVGAAFINVGLPQDGFLNLRVGADGTPLMDMKGTPIQEGAGVLVQIDRAAIANKGPRLSTEITLSDGDGTTLQEIIAAASQTNAPALLRPGPDIVDRALSDWMSTSTLEVVVDDPSLAHRMRGLMRGAIQDDALSVAVSPGGRPAFDHEGINEAFYDALEPTVPLANGGRMIVQETAALTAIDVDQAQATSGNAERLALETNLAAVDALSTAMRLRQLGGLVVVDFLRMRSAENRKKVLGALRAAVRNDPAVTGVSGFSRNGLIEIVRRRSFPSLTRLMSNSTQSPSPETTALEALHAIRQLGSAQPLVRLPSQAAALLQGSLRDELRKVEADIGVDIQIEDYSDADRQGFEVVEDRK